MARHVSVAVPVMADSTATSRPSTVTANSDADTATPRSPTLPL